MKDFSKTFILLGIVLIFGIYVVWDFTSNREKEDFAPGEEILNQGFIPAEISDLSLIRAQEKIRLTFSKAGECQIVEPIQDQCDLTSIDSLLNQVSNMKGTPTEASNLTEMGLGDGQGTQLEIHQKDGKTIRFHIGEKNTYDGRFYVQVNSKIYTGGVNTGQLTNKGLSQLRSLKVWRSDLKPSQMDEVHMSLRSEGQKEDYIIAREGARWTLKSPKDLREMDNEKVANWLKALESLSASQVTDGVIEVKGGSELSFWAKGKEEYKIIMADEVRDSKTRRSMKVPEGSLRKIRVPYWFFFNGKKPFEFDLEQASQLLVTRDGSTDQFDRADRKWTYTGKKKDFNEALFPTFFEKLKELEALTYLKSQKWYGLEQTDKRRILLKNKEGKSILDFTWGENFKPNQGPYKNQNLKYVRVENTAMDLGVADQKIQALLNLDLFSSKPVTPGEHDGHVH